MRVVLIDSLSCRAESLVEAFNSGGFEVFIWSSSDENLYDFMERVQPHAVVVDVDSPSRDTLEHLAQLGENHPKPMIMLTEKHCPDTVLEAAKAGVSMYVVDEMSGPLARSLVDVSVAHFQNTQQLRSELSQTQSQLESRKAIDKAKSLLIEHARMSEREAHDHIRKKAMRDRVTKHKVADDIIALVEQTARQKKPTK